MGAARLQTVNAATGGFLAMLTAVGNMAAALHCGGPLSRTEGTGSFLPGLRATHAHRIHIGQHAYHAPIFWTDDASFIEYHDLLYLHHSCPLSASFGLAPAGRYGIAV